MPQVEFRMTVGYYYSSHIVSFVPQTIPFPMANSVTEVNSRADAACVTLLHVYCFCCMVLLVSLGAVYWTEGKLGLGDYIRTKWITPQSCLLPSSQEPKLTRCRRLHLVTLKPEE